MSLSARSGEGLLPRAEVPLSATFSPKLRWMAPPQRIHTPPPETRGTDGTPHRPLAQLPDHVHRDLS